MSGGLIGLKRRGTITSYNGDGTVVVKLDDTSSVNEDINTHSLQLPLAYSTPNGGFIGGYPEINTPVLLEQGQSEWFISGYAKPDNIYNNGNLIGIGSNDLMGDLLPGRLLIQTNNASNRIYLDQSEGIVSGNANSYQQQDPNRSIISHTYASDWRFTLADRNITGEIKRDISDNAVRNISGSPLTDHSYNDSLWSIGMDPELGTSFTTSSNLYRNLSLSENRSIFYEFNDPADNTSFSYDRKEADKYDPTFQESNQSIDILRVNMRSDAFGLNLYYPNHLIEDIKGTGVDIFGNIIDLNRAIIPLGKGELTFTDNKNNIDAFRKIRAAHRKSIAYHFEINARKALDNDAVYEPPAASNRNNYARDRSTFFFDIDKEGQFKINVPMSSEIGNIPLTTRYTNSSVLAFEANKVQNPNAFFIESDSIDIFTENYSSNKNSSGISLINDSGAVGPLDRFSSNPIKLNTAYHDILKAGYVFTKERIKDDLLVRYMPSSRLNQEQQSIQQDNLITDKIIVGGSDANAGGRSGTINMDGFLNLSIGANTVDRQSLWLDTAGGIVSSIGRDKRGISYSSTLDGDMLIQVGGPGLGSTLDDRFSNQNAGARSGAVDIRVVKSDGQLTIVRIDEQGVNITTYGRLALEAQQDIVLRSNSNILMEAPNIVMYAESMPKVIKRNGVEELG